MTERRTERTPPARDEAMHDHTKAKPEGSPDTHRHDTETAHHHPADKPPITEGEHKNTG